MSTIYETLQEIAKDRENKDLRNVANMILGEYRATYCEDGEDDEDFDDRVCDLIDYWINESKYIDSPTRVLLIYISNQINEAQTRILYPREKNK